MSPELLLKSIIGETITSIEGARRQSMDIVFTLANGDRYLMNHQQDCCESVEVHHVSGDIQNIIGAPVLSAVEDNNEQGSAGAFDDSHTWTRFIITTKKGSVEISWLGQSSGYYSENVSFSKID